MKLRRLAEQRSNLLGELETSRKALLKKATSTSRLERELLLTHLVASLAENRAEIQRTWLRYSAELERRDRAFREEMRTRNVQTSQGLPDPPHLAVGSVFAPYRVYQGVRPWMVALMAISFVFVATRQPASGGTEGRDWLPIVLSVMISLPAFVSAYLDWQNDRRRRQAEKLAAAAPGPSSESNSVVTS